MTTTPKIMGCADAGPPIFYTPSQLSRLKDFLDELNSVTRDAIWLGLPTKMKMEFNWTRWEYVRGG